jgi:geranylgeranyl pyrophosphate synthase
MVGGEYIDIMAEGVSVPRETLDKMHALKTGALIRGACMLGAISAGVMPGDARMTAVVTYAECIGLAFQITDDVLDRTGTAESLGKNPGTDDASGKTTFLSFMSVDEAKATAAELTARAVNAIKDISGSDTLVALAIALSGRDF